MAVAAEINVEPSIALAATYTDNVLLTPDGFENGDFVTEVMPAINIRAIGKRFDIDFDYRLQGLIYTEQDDFNDTLSYSKSSGTAKLIGDSLLIDFLGRINQQIIDPGNQIGISGITRSNRTETGHFSVNPYWQRKLGRNGGIKIGYRYGFVEYDDVMLIDSESNGLSATLNGQPPRSPLSWRIDASQSTIEYDTGAEVQLQRVGGELAFSFGENTALFVGGGDENNEFNQLVGPQKIDGTFWNVGLRGQLDRRTTYSISAGEQHFGDSYQFSLQRTAGKLRTDISYLEETTTVGQQQQAYEALFEYLTEITGVELPTVGAEVYVRKGWTINTTLELSRSKWRLGFFDEKRDYLTSPSGEGDGVLEVAASWTWTALERTEFGATLGWQKFDLRNSLDDPRDLRLQFRLRRNLGNGFFVFTRIWHNRRAAETVTGEYKENAISVGLDKRF